MATGAADASASASRACTSSGALRLVKMLINVPFCELPPLPLLDEPSPRAPDAHDVDRRSLLGKIRHHVRLCLLAFRGRLKLRLQVLAGCLASCHGSGLRAMEGGLREADCRSKSALVVEHVSVLNGREQGGRADGIRKGGRRGLADE